MTKKHWTQTEEGKKRMTEIQKEAWIMRKKKPVHWTQTPDGRARVKQILNGARASIKVGRPRETGTVVIIKGPDARKALAELISNAQYDNLNVRILVRSH